MKRKILLLFTLLTPLTPYTLNSQWYQQPIPVSKPIAGIKFLDTLNGWACTSNGQPDSCYILHTTNGGINWIRQFQLYNSDFFALSMLNLSTGYVSGYNYQFASPIVYKTINSGLNWISINAPTAGDDIFFVNPNTGFICDNVFADIWRTNNGGVNWTQIVGLNLPNRLFFLNADTGWCGTQSNLYKTTNAGANWGLSNVGVSGGVLGIYFKDISTGWVSLGNGRVGRTTNGGVNWNINIPDPVSGNLYEIYFKDSIGWTGTMSFVYRIYKSLNYGIYWGYQVDSGNSYRISVVDTLHQWTGSFGIYYTNNGGGLITYVGVSKNSNQIPKYFLLYQNYPNPFNSQTVIKFSIIKSSYAKLRIYDESGKEKNLWESSGLLSPGIHELNFSATGGANDMASGVYFYQLIVTDDHSVEIFKETKKMILIK